MIELKVDSLKRCVFVRGQNEPHHPVGLWLEQRWNTSRQPSASQRACCWNPEGCRWKEMTSFRRFSYLSVGQKLGHAPFQDEYIIIYSDTVCHSLFERQVLSPLQCPTFQCFWEPCPGLQGQTSLLAKVHVAGGVVPVYLRKWPHEAILQNDPTRAIRRKSSVIYREAEKWIAQQAFLLISPTKCAHCKWGDEPITWAWN